MKPRGILVGMLVSGLTVTLVDAQVAGTRPAEQNVAVETEQPTAADTPAPATIVPRPPTTQPSTGGMPEARQLEAERRREAMLNRSDTTLPETPPYQQYTPYTDYSGRMSPNASLYSGQPMYPHYSSPAQSRYYYSTFSDRKFDNYGRYSTQFQSRRSFGRLPVNRLSYGIYDHDYDYGRYNNINWSQRYDSRGYNPYDLQRNNPYAASSRGISQTTMHGGRQFNATPQFNSTQKPKTAKPTQGGQPGTTYPRPVYPGARR